jgi:hypothetical protein
MNTNISRNDDDEEEDEAEPCQCHEIDSTDSSTGQTRWVLFGKRIPKAEIVFFAQVCILYIVIIAAIINLTLDNGTPTLWTALLSSSLGYLLPNPTLDKEKVRENKTKDGNQR